MADLTKYCQKPDGSKWIQCVLHSGSGLSRFHNGVITAGDGKRERGSTANQSTCRVVMSGKV